MFLQFVNLMLEKLDVPLDVLYFVPISAPLGDIPFPLELAQSRFVVPKALHILLEIAAIPLDVPSVVSPSVVLVVSGIVSVVPIVLVVPVVAVVTVVLVVPIVPIPTILRDRGSNSRHAHKKRGCSRKSDQSCCSVHRTARLLPS
jgi:hypothetical protein